MAKEVIILNTIAGVGGMTSVQYVMWLVPPGAAVVPNPNFISSYAGATASEISALQLGTTIEQVFTSEYPSSFTLAAIETDLLAKYNTAQAALTSGINPIQWYGTYYDSGTWTPQSLSLPSLRSSGFVSTTWTSSTPLNTVLEIPVGSASSISVPIVVTGTITAGVVSFQVSSDGINWLPIQGTLSASFQPIEAWSLASGNTAVSFNVAGYSYFRAQLTTVITGTGTVTLIEQSALQSLSLVSAGAVATYNSTAPSPSNGSGVPMQADAYGNLFVNDGRRSQVVSATGNIASATAATLLAAQGAGVYADLSSLVLTLREGATANVFFGVNISDGTKTYRFNFMSQDVVTFAPSHPVLMSFNPPLPATNANVAWTIALTSATDTPSVDYVCTFVQQKTT